MTRSLRHGLQALAALATLASATAIAAPARAADPTDPRAEVPPLHHASALDRYRRLSPEPLGDWRAAHDTVARIGGWRAYLREAHAPEAAASASSNRPSGPSQPSSGGHPHHGGGRR
jgi:hypothetical protein